MSYYLLCEGLMLCRGAIHLSTDYSFASLCIMYVWLNLLRRVLRLKWLHELMFPLLNTASRPLSTCFRSNYFDFVFPCIRFRFPDRALPFPYPFPHKNMKTKVVRVFSRLFPTVFIPIGAVGSRYPFLYSYWMQDRTSHASKELVGCADS